MSRLSHRRRRWGSAAAAAASLITLALPMSASAIAPADVPAIGADTGRFTLPIKCGISIDALNDFKLIDVDATVDIQGIAPVQLGPGQPFYLSQGSGALTLPSWISTLAGIVGINRADANVSQVNIAATGSTPEVINLADLQPLVANNVRIEGGKPITVGLPQTGKFNIGPYKAPASGVTALKFISAKASVTIRSDYGLAVGIKADCKAAAQAGGGASLLSIAVGGAPSNVPVNFQNQPLNFPVAPVNQLIGIVNSPYTCQYAGKSYDIGVAVSATIPLTVQRNGSLPFAQASGALVVPAATVDRWISEGKRTFGGTVTTLTLRVQGGTPDNKNVIPLFGIKIPTTTLVAGQKLTIPLPQSGTLSAGPFKPNAGASAVVVGMGKAAANLSFNGAAEQPATCGEPSPSALLVDAAVVS